MSWRTILISCRWIMTPLPLVLPTFRRGWQRCDPSSDDELNARSERFLQRLSSVLPSRTTHWSRRDALRRPWRNFSRPLSRRPGRYRPAVNLP
jgi:hypothetical protein